jgi:hypothetical protein
MCIVFVLQQTATFTLYNINWFFNRDEKCLLRGTYWVFNGLSVIISREYIKRTASQIPWIIIPMKEISFLQLYLLQL